MFKKLKDKLAEEVKSSPQRIQQFAQAAQAAVTSASSSISDITNNDLFSIGDSDSQQSHSAKAPMPSSTPNNTFQDVSLVQTASPLTSTESVHHADYASSHDIIESQRQRRLSNSSFTSDVSFRLPSYESPSMYHLQSDMEVSASEAEERSFSGTGLVSLDRVTKEQIYAAYRRTQERYTKYRTQYADLARHYKLLERENAKARSVLVETQDKALRRISELREQCSLEQSAKAHLEKSLRVDIEERNMKIETLNTKIKLLQSNDQGADNGNSQNTNTTEREDVAQLITFSENETKPRNDVALTSEITALNNKVDKLEQLVNKYKESLKMSKEKNAQLTTELQMLSNELEKKNKENEQLKITVVHLTEAKQKIQVLTDTNEELQNMINTLEFTKTKEISTLEIDLQKSEIEIKELREKIEIFTKREEENAISLAENKLSIHKELESKENEIKSLKDSLSATKKEIQSLKIVISDYKTTVTSLEEEKSKLCNNINDLHSTKTKLTELEAHIQELAQKCQSLESSKTKADEEYKCFQLQLKQETAEKLAMIDRNSYLENRNAQLTDENGKKSSQVSNLESELQRIKKDNKKKTNDTDDELLKSKMMEEITTWKNKYSNLESEIQEEREELVKLQSEIEKLLANYELIQTQNIELHNIMSDLKAENAKLHKKISNGDKIKTTCEGMLHKVNDLQQIVSTISQETKTFRKMNNDAIFALKENVKKLILSTSQINEIDIVKAAYDELKSNYSTLQEEFKKVSDQCVKTKQELDTLQKQNDDLKLKLRTSENENVSVKEEIQNINSRYESNLAKLQSISEEKQSLVQGLKDSENRCQLLQTTIKENGNKNSVALDSVNALKHENQLLVEKFKIVEENNMLLNTEIHKLKNENHKLTNECNTLEKESHKMRNTTKNSEDHNMSLSTELNKLRTENNDLMDKINVFEEQIDAMNNKNKSCEDENNILRKENKDVIHIYNLLQEEYNTLHKKVKESEQENKLLGTEATKLRNETDDILVKFNMLEKENDTLKDKTKSFEEKNFYIEQLEGNIKALTQENISLKSQSETISKNIQNLQSELCDVRKSHTEMEIEKDRLNSVIEKFEMNEHARDVIEKDTQTDLLSLQSNKATNTTELDSDSDREKTVEMKQLQEVNGELSNQLLQQCTEKEKHELKENEQTEKYLALNEEHNALKEENKRLHSDIAGLQSYLSKISKENSTLNDKLRELIASSENSPDKNDMRNLSELKNEIELGKDKIDQLIRENTLLAEENLELKDQLNPQNCTKSTDIANAKDLNYDNLKEKYNKLLESKNILEKRVNDLEDMNKSVNGNMLQMQDNNEKLRLSNEKLGRRLDEALVSLRHLHSLQENTELEYLRNILYEYLTGSGTHSVTLAKVLAAVVKFDDTQTQQVLQKEKERQGLLRQLGII